MTAVPAIVPPPDGLWIDAWISPDRLSRYLKAADGDRVLALTLYEWNAQLGAALLRDLGHLEVALRNAYDRSAAAWAGPGHWLVHGADVLFAPVLRTKRHQQAGRWAKRQVDINSKPRELIGKAIRDAGGEHASPGKVVAELSFGFWRYLSSSAHEKTLWVPLLHRAFPLHASRADVDGRIGRLHELRNRAAHHEPLLEEDVNARVADLLTVAGLLHDDLRTHLVATSAVPSLIAARPCGR